MSNWDEKKITHIGPFLTLLKRICFQKQHGTEPGCPIGGIRVKDTPDFKDLERKKAKYLLDRFFTPITSPK